ncbi:MAG TPA: hypothetical protein PKD55_13015 [Bellilinea sp.]|nr:hypothetical protein [Bellilinea sp.]
MQSRPFPTDVTLTAIALAYQNNAAEMIHKRVLPPVPVISERFSWLSYPIAEAFTVPDLEVGRRGRVGEVNFSAEKHESSTRDYGLDDVIPITDIDEAKHAREQKRSTYNPETAAVTGLTNLIELGREVRAARIVENPENYDTGRKVAISNANDKFSKFDTSDPFGVLNAGMTKPLIYRANTIAMGQEVWEVIKRHPRLIKAVKGAPTEDGAINRQQFADLMEIERDRLLIGVSMVNSAARGQPANLVKVWGNFIALLFVDNQKQAPDDNILTWGFTAELGNRLAGSIHDPHVGIRGGSRIRVAEQVHELVCAKSLGYLIQNPIAAG